MTILDMTILKHDYLGLTQFKYPLPSPPPKGEGTPLPLGGVGGGYKNQ